MKKPARTKKRVSRKRAEEPESFPEPSLYGIATLILSFVAICVEVVEQGKYDKSLRPSAIGKKEAAKFRVTTHRALSPKSA